MAERFFDDDTGPLAVLFLGEAGLTELLHDGREKSLSDREIEKPVAAGVVLLIDIVDLLRQTLERLGILKVTLDVIDPFGEPGPNCGVDLGGRIFGDFFRESLAKTFRSEIVAGEADDGELLGEQIVTGKVAERGNELPLGEVAGGPEDNHNAGRGGGVCIDVTHSPLSCPGLARGGRDSVASTSRS